MPRRRTPSLRVSRERESPATEAQDHPVRTEVTSQRARRPRDHPERDTTRTGERVERDPSANTTTRMPTRSPRDPLREKVLREMTSPEATEEAGADEVEEAEVKAVVEEEVTKPLPRSERAWLSD